MEVEERRLAAGRGCLHTLVVQGWLLTGAFGTIQPPTSPLAQLHENVE